MLVIDYEEIKALNISYTECYTWVEEMIRHKKDAQLPPKTHMTLPGNIFCNVMPSIVNIAGRMVGGVKIVSRYPDRKPSLDSKIILMDMDSGEFLALLDGNWITAMRTGAVAAHSIMQFAVEDYFEIGIVGLGNTARATLLMLLSENPVKKMQIKLLRYKDQAELFTERFAGYDNIDFLIVDRIEELVDNSDVVISCATYFDQDICDDRYYKEGVLVVPVHTRGFTNCDLFFDKVYADDTGHVDHFKNFNRFKYFAEVSDVINGDARGRESDKERILAYNIGLSIHDIYYASHIFDLIHRSPSMYSEFRNIDMREPQEKFWI